MKFAGPVLIAISIFCLLPFSSFAQLNKQKPENLQEVGIEEQRGNNIPLNLTFATSTGDSVTLGELMHEEDEKPVLLNPVYYECPMLCSMVTEAVFAGVKELKWSPGSEYTIITFSIDPEENHELAASVKDSIINKLDRPEAGNGWHFLTGSEEAIKELTDTIGFKYEKVDRTDQYAHSAAIMFLSPRGILTRYLYGIKFDEFNIRNALYEAADGKIGSAVDQVLLYCYQYDPDSQSYVPVAWKIMRVAGFATAAVLGIFLGLMWFKEKKSTKDKNIT